jgi:uncharacterized protein YvpB
MKLIYLLALFSFSIQASDIKCDFFSVNTDQSCTPFGGIKLDVPMQKQKRSLSCEAAALTSALNYFGAGTTEEKVIEKMPFDKTLKTQDVWGDPDFGFVGDINGRSITSGYGIYWKPISRLSSKWKKADWIIHGSIRDITDQIRQKKPVLIWISALKNADIIFWKTTSGKKVRALQDQHVVVVSGYEGSAELPIGFHVMDPDEGMKFMDYNDFISRWDRFERPAVVFRD